MNVDATELEELTVKAQEAQKAVSQATAQIEHDAQEAKSEETADGDGIPGLTI